MRFEILQASIASFESQLEGHVSKGDALLLRNSHRQVRQVARRAKLGKLRMQFARSSTELEEKSILLESQHSVEYALGIVLRIATAE